jgi:hypothetical protein
MVRPLQNFCMWTQMLILELLEQTLSGTIVPWELIWLMLMFILTLGKSSGSVNMTSSWNEIHYHDQDPIPCRLPYSVEDSHLQFVNTWMQQHIYDAANLLGMPILIGEFGVLKREMKFHPSIMHLSNFIITISLPNGVLSCLHTNCFFIIYLPYICWLPVMKLFDVKFLLPVMSSAEDLYLEMSECFLTYNSKKS